MIERFEENLLRLEQLNHGDHGASSTNLSLWVFARAKAWGYHSHRPVAKERTKGLFELQLRAMLFALCKTSFDSPSRSLLTYDQRSKVPRFSNPTVFTTLRE